jgi:hypothetical protein
VLDGLIALVMASLSASLVYRFLLASNAITDLDRTGAIGDKDGMKTASGARAICICGIIIR